MSSIRCSRSSADAWIVLANSICFGVRVESWLSASSRDSNSSELSGVRSSWLMLARNSDLYTRRTRPILSRARPLSSAACSAVIGRQRR